MNYREANHTQLAANEPPIIPVSVSSPHLGVYKRQRLIFVASDERLLKHYLPFDKRQSTSYKNHFFPNASLLVLSFRYISG